HGSIRSPIWKGGGVAFGPRNEKVYARKINRQMRIKALYSALSKKVKDGEVLFVDSLAFSAPSTKGASGFMHALAGVKGHEDLKDKKHNAAYIALTQKDAQVQKSFNNLGNVKVGEVRNLSAKDAVTYRYIIIVGPKEGAALLEARGGNRQEEEKEANVTK
ncbi:MAG: uL4 family ribosomal protein, partial [bacterium]|nr:uL4 family ribosomal protein [bacterium]